VRAFLRIAALTLAVASVGQGGEETPSLLLYLPFDGSADAAFLANGQSKVSALDVRYHPGKRGKAAEIGSARFPCGVVVRSTGVLNKDRGTVEFWFSPFWDSVDAAEQAAPHMLFTDELDSGMMGHLWLALEGRALHFGWRGQQVEGIVAPIRDWRRGTWHHIAATWDQDRGMALYLDAELAAERPIQWRLPPSDWLYIGASRQGSAPAAGLFDEFRIYDRALTGAEVELASIGRLQAPLAPVRPLPRLPDRGARAKEPTLTFHVPFEGGLAAKTAAGNPKPLVAEGIELTNGLLGTALATRPGTQLTYASEKNLSTEAGAATFWARSLPNARQARGVLLVQGFEGKLAPGETPHLLTLQLERGPVTQLILSIGPASVRASLPRWNEGEWHHIAACWLRGRELALYVNGRAAARRTGAATFWNTTPAMQFDVGAIQGRNAAEAVIDDLRIYDAPLSTDQARKEAGQFVLLFVADVRPTLVERGKDAELTVNFRSLAPDRVTAKAQIQILSPQGKQVASAPAELDAAPHATASIKVSLPAAALAADGLYSLTMTSPGRVATPGGYFLAVPPVERQAATDGKDDPQPALTPVETIECVKVTEADRFCQTGRAAAVDSPRGAYCQAGPDRDDRFAYRFRIAAGQPHLATITYPDDQARSAEITMNSPRFPNSYDVAAGYFRPGDPPRGDPIRLPIYFWPREQENALVFRTLESGRPAACARISICRLDKALPSARAETPPDGGRAVGLHWEDPAVPLQFGATDLSPPDLYRCFSRLAEYLRFTGQNLISYPVAWHKGLLYSSEKEDFEPGTASERHCGDWIEYLLYLCERLSLRFLPEIVLDDTFALANAYGEQTADDVAAGIETPRMVLWDGTLSRGGPTEPPLYDPLHPAVRAALLDRMDEIASRYGRSPALEGVSLRLGVSQLAWYASLQCGYGDCAVAQFERETGIPVPADKSGFARFSQRAAWLLNHKRDEWIAWRCRKLAELYAEAAQRLQAAGGHLQLSLALAIPNSASPYPLLNLTAWAAPNRSLDQLYREGGVDLALCARVPNLAVRRVIFPIDAQYVLYQFGTRSNPNYTLSLDALQLDEGYAPFRALPAPAVTGVYRFFESSVGALRPTPGYWWTENPWRASQPTPAGRLFLEPHATALAQLDIQAIAVGGFTTVTMGHEEEVLDFARAFRALPRKGFQDVQGMADPVCARQLREGDNQYLYLVNRAPYPTEAFVAFDEKGLTVRDLAASQDAALPYVEAKPLPAAMPRGFISEHQLQKEVGPVPGAAETEPVTGSLLHVKLEPFQLRSYRLPATGAKIAHASSSAPLEERLRLAQAFETAKTLVASARADVGVIEAARATLALAERARRKREFVRAAALLRSYPLERLR